MLIVPNDGKDIDREAARVLTTIDVYSKSSLPHEDVPVVLLKNTARVSVTGDTIPLAQNSCPKTVEAYHKFRRTQEYGHQRMLQGRIKRLNFLLLRTIKGHNQEEFIALLGKSYEAWIERMINE
jgi:hypothetical protein